MSRVKQLDIFSAILLLYFPVSYFLLFPRFSSISLPIQWGFMFIGIIYLMVKKLKLSKMNSLSLSYLYMIFLCVMLSLTSMFALNPSYSFIRGILSVITFAIALTVFYNILIFYSKSQLWRNYFSIAILFSLLIIIIGQLLIPEWKSGGGGVRLSGGTNPNQVGFYALFITFMSHYNSILDKKWTKINKINWILSFVVIMWSMSRSIILSLVIFYFIYFSYFILRKYIFNYLLLGKIPKSIVKKTFYVILVIVGITFAFKYIKTLPSYQFIEARFTGTSGIESRTEAWQYLLTYFYDNPIFGGIGWFNATNLVDNVVDANSPHNLYVRLLSETGLIGLVSVLIYPSIICIMLIIISFRLKDNEQKNIKQTVLTFTFLIAIFIGQFFEDRYLVGFINVTNSIFICILAISLYLINNAKNHNNKHIE